jgi:methionine-rich copper-binding protein CopC
MAYQPKSYRKFLAGTISAAVVASAIAPAASAAELKFKDTAGLDAETTAAIEALVGSSVIVGYPDGTFKPNQTINRGQAAEMIVKALPNVEPKANPTGKVFEDLTEKSYSSKFAEALVDAGLIPAGGKFGAGTGMTREAMAVTLVSAFGLKDTGAAVEIKDLDKAAEASRAAIKILAQHGLTKLLDGNFNPTADVTRSQFALFFYRAVAATVAVTEVAEIKSVNETTLEVKVKGSLKTVAPTDFTFDGGLTVTAAEIVPAAAADTFTTVKLTTSKQEVGKTYKLVTFLGKEVKTEVKVEVPAAVVPKIDTLTTNNLKEVTVKFTSKVNAVEAAKKENYSVKIGTAAAVAPANVAVAADGLSAVLTLDGSIAQQGSADVTVKKAVGLAADETKTISNVLDTTIPTADSITLTGPNTFAVKFSEPVQDGVAVSINNGVYGIDSSKTTLSADRKTLNVTLSASTLPEGTYNVKVDGFRDFAPFAGVAKTFAVEYKKDVTLPTVELVSASQTEVKVKFNKPVYANGVALTKDYFYHTYSAWKPVSVTTTDAQTYTLKFKDEDALTQDYYLPVGGSTVTVLAKVGDNAVKDGWGNLMAADAKLAATVTADSEAPTVKSVTTKSESKVEILFSEDVTLNSDSFTVKDSAGKVVTTVPTVTPSTTVTGLVTLDWGTTKLTGGTYTVEIKNVKDKALAPNTITAVTHSFTVTDLTAPNAPTGVVVEDSATATVVYLTFNEDMATTGAGSILALGNYRLDGKVLPTGSKVELFGSNKKVKITLPKQTVSLVSTDTTHQTLAVGQLADANGNAMENFSTAVTIAADTAPNAFTAAAIGKNKLELVFNAEVTTVTADGITVSYNGGTAQTVAAVDSVVYNATTGKTTVTVTTKAEVNLANTSKAEADKLAVNVVNGKLATITGKTLGAISLAATNVADKMAASILSTGAVVDNTAAGTNFLIKFNEELASASHGFYANDLVITDSTGKVLTAGIDYTTSVTTGSSDINVNVEKAGKYTVKSKDAVLYIKDAQGNTVNGFTTAIEVTVAE